MQLPAGAFNIFDLANFAEPNEILFPGTGFSSRAGRRGNLSDLCVVIGVMLLVHEHKANVEASAAGNVDTLMRRIKIDAFLKSSP